MGAPAVGDIVLVPFPYSDLSNHKLRPALVVALSDRGDVILCQITSRRYASDRALPLAAASTGLERDSFLRPDKLFTADARLIVRRIAGLDSHATRTARQAVASLFD